MLPLIKALADPKQRRALHEMKARLEKRDRQEQKRKGVANDQKRK